MLLRAGRPRSAPTTGHTEEDEETKVENVVVLKFAELDRAREAMRHLQRLHFHDSFRLEAMAAVKGDGDGRVSIVEEKDPPGRGETAAGTTIDTVLGILTAPAQVALGGAAGAIVGSVLDITDVEDSETVAAKISGSVAPRNTAIVAVVEEPSPAVLNRLAVRCGAQVVRQPRGEVDRELAVAAAVPAARPERAFDRPIGERVSEVKDVLKEALRRPR